MKTNLTYSLFSKIIKYNPKTGNFFWLKRDARKRNLIKPKHDFISGYPHLCVYGKYYSLLDLAYLAMEKELPKEGWKIIPKNNNKYDIKYKNLRLVGNEQKDIISYTPTEFSGIWFCEKIKLWRVHININNKKHILGHFESFNQAVMVLWKIKKKKQNGLEYTYLLNKGLI